ncbi:MAG: rod shape-determining protein MreD [Novosphingobium sp.]
MASRPPLFPQRWYPKEINRTHSPILATALPWLSIMLGSLVPQWYSIFSSGLVPPFGYLMLVSWRQVRPGVLPVWAGWPLGMFDDLYSGLPFGTGVLLWSATLIIMEVLEARYPWRGVIVDWLVGASLASAYLIITIAIASHSAFAASAASLAIQLALAALLLPLCGRFVSWCDRLRLLRFRSID